MILQTKLQHQNKSVAVFVEEMKHLFSQIDAEKLEEKKLGYLFRRNFRWTDAKLTKKHSRIRHEGC